MHLPSLVNLIQFPHASLWKPLHPLADHHELASSTPIAFVLPWHYTTWSEDCRRRTPSNLFQSSYRAGHSTDWDRFVTYCKRYSIRSGQWQHFCRSSFVGSFCRFWHSWPPNSPLPPELFFFSFFWGGGGGGIQSTAALQWFQSFRSDRYQSTWVNNSSSSPSQLISYGVPQGSVPGAPFSSSCTLHLSPRS